MTELHLMTAIFEREHKYVDLKYYEGNGGEYELTVVGQFGSECVLYFTKDGRYKGCIACQN